MRAKYGPTMGHFMWKFEFGLSQLKKALKKRIKALTALDYSKIDDIEVDGVDLTDYPDFCDAYIVTATYKGRPMTEAELDKLNDDRDFVYECVQYTLY